MSKKLVLFLLSFLVLADVSTAIKKEIRRKKLPSDPSQLCGIKSGEIKKSNSKNIPPGPYRRSCGYCKLEGELLVCDACSDSVGNEARSEIDVHECQSFMNLDGELLCTQVMFDDEPGIPPGQYLDLCGGCSVKADPADSAKKTLTCSCLDDEGELGLRQLALSPDCEVVGFDYRELRCYRAGDPRIPEFRPPFHTDMDFEKFYREKEEERKRAQKEMVGMENLRLIYEKYGIKLDEQGNPIKDEDVTEVKYDDDAVDGENAKKEL